MKRITVVALLLGLQCLLPPSRAETYDIVEPHKLPPKECPKGCAQWTDLKADGNPANQTAVDALWRDAGVRAAAGSHCAQPGHSPFSEGSGVSGYAGAYCYCKSPTDVTQPLLGYCVSPSLTPEQINLQVAAADVLVASFVTFGDLTDNTPIARLSTTPDFTPGTTENITGVTHTYLSPDNDGGVVQTVRQYNMHFIPLKTSQERTKYYYQVAAFKPRPTPAPVPNAKVCHGWTCTIEGQLCPPGTPGSTGSNGDRCCNKKWVPLSSKQESCPTAAWSAVKSFKSLYTTGETRLAVFGDMGMMTDGNTNHANMLRDGMAGRIDFFAHMGDHAYQMSSSDDKRGDGYMNAYEPLTSKVPWLPIIGNHEYYDNAIFHRFLNQSYGVQLSSGATSLPHGAKQCGHQYGCATQAEISGRHPTLLNDERITADSALGTFITRGNVLAAGSSSTSNAVPSNTSRWYSADVGLIHLIALDIMVYPGGTPDLGPNGIYQQAQHDWLEADLKAVDRKRTPWVIAMAHHPLYCSSITMGVGTTEGELEKAGPSTQQLHETQQALLPPGKSYKGCTGTGEDWIAKARVDLEPLFLKYGLDLYLAGHEHNYESTFPIKNCSMGSSGCYIGKDFTAPQAPVYVTCGEGGTNGGDHFGDNWGPWTRKELGHDTPGECTTLSSGSPTMQAGCSAGYGRLVAHNHSHMTYQYVLNVNDTVWDEWTIVQPHHGSFN